MIVRVRNNRYHFSSIPQFVPQPNDGSHKMSVTTLESAAPVTSSPLLGLSLAELTAWVQERGQPAYRGKQLYQWIYQQGARSLADITVFSKQWRETVKDVPIGRSIVHQRAVATDGTIKYLLQLHDGQIVEAVGIPSAKRLTVCVSSQVGCAMACKFCATGKGALPAIFRFTKSSIRC